MEDLVDAGWTTSGILDWYDNSGMYPDCRRQSGVDEHMHSNFLLDDMFVLGLIFNVVCVVAVIVAAGSDAE